MRETGAPHRAVSAVCRRRAIVIAAAVGAPFFLWPGLALSGTTAEGEPRLHRWRGRVFGTDTTILLHGMSEARARRLMQRCRAEIGRLENLFSLYRPGSGVARLNSDGRLRDPPYEFVALLSRSLRFSDLTGGAFDVTVQPLWKLYAAHFARPDPDPAGPVEAARADALRLVDHTAVEVGNRTVAFARPGMAVTLNGIAQGYITDRIVDLLRDHGVTGMLVDLGETRVQGRHPTGRPWTIGLVDPTRPSRLAKTTLALGDEAVASSGAYGMQFDPAGRHHHLFDRSSGKSARYNLGVTVRAPSATTADALSTALSVMPHGQALRCLDHFGGVEAIMTMHDGSVVTARSGDPARSQ